MRLVDDQRVVGAQIGVALRLGQQNTVRHQLDRSVFRQAVLKTHLVAHHLAQGRLQLVGNALGHTGGGHAARLRVADQLAALARLGVARAAPHVQRDLGQLRGLARAGFTTDNEHLVRAQGGFDLVPPGRNRQRFGEFDAQWPTHRQAGRKIDRFDHSAIISGTVSRAAQSHVLHAQESLP